MNLASTDVNPTEKPTASTPTPNPTSTPIATPTPDKSRVLVTVGETKVSLEESARGDRPRGEESFLRERFGVVHSMNEWKPEKSANTIWQILFAAKITLSLLRTRKKPTVVYCTEEFPGLYLVAFLCIICRNIPVVLLVHNVSSKKRQLFLQRKFFRARINQLLCLSETSAAILKGFGVDPARLHVIGSRVDCEFFSPVTTAEPALIVSAGAINRDYNTLLEACAGLDVHVTIAADTAWRHSLGKLPEEMSGERFEMRSFGNYRNLRDLYARSTLMVVPLVEGQFASGQTVILEGMAMGKAMITTDIAGRSDFIDDGVNGMYVPSHNVEALRAAIAALLADPERRARMADAGRAAAVEKYKVEHYVTRILKACDLAAAAR
jgi:glycosyltransferase involved in cell wall biosynthesis